MRVRMKGRNSFLDTDKHGQGRTNTDRRSHAHGLQNDALRALSVPFAVKNALPGAEIEAAFSHRDHDFVANRERPKVRGGVVLASARIVAISLRIPGGNVVLEPLQYVLPEVWLVVVHED